MTEYKKFDENALVKIEFIGSNTQSVMANLLGFIGANAVVSHGSEITSQGVFATGGQEAVGEVLVNDELIATRALLESSEAENASLRNDLKVATAQLKDAQASATKAHKALEQEEKQTKGLTAQLETLKAALAKAEGAAPLTSTSQVVDNATNDADADSAIAGAETVASGDATVKAQPGARGQRTVRNVSKPAEETAHHKALRETITNDLLDLGGLAEKNEQVATDVNEIFDKYKISNGADLTVEQLEDAAADINELIKVYFRE